MSSIGERIRDLRKDCGLTLEKFGARLGVSKVAISKLENGVSSLTPQMAKSIIREFGVCEEWLVNGNPPKYPELNKEQQLHAWADKVLADSPDSFRYRFVAAMSRLPDDWWWLVEKAALQILAEYDPEKAMLLSEADSVTKSTEETPIEPIYQIQIKYHKDGEPDVSAINRLLDNKKANAE